MVIGKEEGQRTQTRLADQTKAPAKTSVSEYPWAVMSRKWWRGASLRELTESHDTQDMSTTPKIENSKAVSKM